MAGLLSFSKVMQYTSRVGRGISVLPQTDMVLNCFKWPKQRKDFLITKEILKLMEPGSMLVDISNDDPGAIGSSHETHRDNPRYVVNDVVHYCVSNIPGTVQ